MALYYHVTGEQRKAVVTAVSAFVDAPAVYQNAPTFAYAIGKYRVDKEGSLTGPANEALPLRQAADGTFDEALSALTMLGFARQASEKVLRALRKEMPAATVEELVRQALKRL